jgi:hypothetical protein
MDLVNGDFKERNESGIVVTELRYLTVKYLFENFLFIRLFRSVGYRRISK